MTIKDIAKLAGVSISTVSKIMNHKDSSISEATREKVLNIIKEYHYAPYSAAALQRNSKTLRIGLLLRSLNHAPTLPGLIAAAQAQGYTILIHESNDDEEQELKGLTALLSHQVDGILWEPAHSEHSENLHYLQEKAIPFILFNAPQAKKSINLNYTTAGYQTTQKLIATNHTDIACLIAEDQYAAAFLEGYKKCLFDHQIPFDENKVYEDINEALIHRISNHQISGLVSSSFALSVSLYETLQQLHFHLPYDLSLISLRDEEYKPGFPHIDALTIPYAKYGRDLSRAMIAYIEKGKKPSSKYQCDFQLEPGATVDLPSNFHAHKILVVGSVNIDHYMRVPELPTSGKSTLTSNFYSYPGGKGINQAIGTARLGGRVSLIGAVGNDIESELILSALNENSIDHSGVYRSVDTITGKAYIFLNDSGDSMISILAGSNQELSPAVISQHESLFENTSYCLLQTEIPADTVLAAAKTAKKHGATTILKPSACSYVSDELLSYIDILVPNYDEVRTLGPAVTNLDTQAQYFLDKGVGTVIITLGADGCFLKNADHSESFPAYDFQPVDNTGAADAFISALAIYLQKAYPLQSAIRIASYAAGFSISREGVVPSLIDGNTLESYIRQTEPEILHLD